MQRIITLFCFSVLLNLILVSGAQACSCYAESTDFFETVAGYNKEILENKSERKPLTVVVATVKEYSDFANERPNSMMLDISEVIQGNKAEKNTKVFGDNGALCRPYVMMFPIGKKFIFALEASENGEYSISNCGMFYKQLD